MSGSMNSRIGSDLLSRLSVTQKRSLLASLLRQKTRLQNIARKQSASPTFVDDAVLDAKIQPIGSAEWTAAPRAVLLTGATGFLGAHLLKELCLRTEATIYTLVRGRDADDARRKLEANFAQYFSHPLDTERVRAIPGDLAEPEFGLSPEAFATLARE